MLKINQIKLPVGQSEQQLEKKIRKILNLPKTESFTYEIIKKSLDARKKPELFYVYTVHVTVHNEPKVKKKIHQSSVSVVTESEYQFPVSGEENLSARPVIVGAGPAGLFAAYQLTEAGYQPIVSGRKMSNTSGTQADCSRNPMCSSVKVVPVHFPMEN